MTTLDDRPVTVTAWAARELRTRQPARNTSDVAWAAADVLAAAYVATRNPGLREAAAGFERAARPPWGRVPPRTAAGDALRTAAWCLYRCQRRHFPGTRLLAVLAGLAQALAELRQAQRRRQAQAEAARRAATLIGAPATATTFRPARPAEPARNAARRASGPQARRSRGLQPGRGDSGRNQPGLRLTRSPGCALPSSANSRPTPLCGSPRASPPLAAPPGAPNRHRAPSPL
jgi:hypothetical protein